MQAQSVPPPCRYVAGDLYGFFSTCGDSLLRIPSHKWEVQHQWEPVPVNEEKNRQKCMHAGFWDDVHVESVAQVDWVDVIAFQIAVHDGEEDLEEEVNGVEEDGKEEEPDGNHCQPPLIHRMCGIL